MDVHHWLQGTTDRAPPDPSHSDEAQLPAFLRAPSNTELARTHAAAKLYRRKRKRSLSDSSIIAPQPVRPQPRSHGRAATHHNRAHSPGRGRSIADGLTSVAGSEKDPRENSSGVEAVEQLQPHRKLYERRPRHKTKADLYERKVKKEHKRRDDHDGKVTSKRRKSHRSGDGGRTAELVQSFQLKNGPKNNRLTLRTDSNAGLFRHGRASAQLAGKSNGLPDLVFNEMRFLQKSHDQQEEGSHNLEADSAKRRTSKKDKRQQYQNKEISNYFAANRQKSREGPRPKKAPEQIVRRRHTSNSLVGQSNERAPSARRQDHAPLEEPFLGFSTRGPSHHSSQPKQKATSYFTRSSSAPHQLSPQVGQRVPGLAQPHRPASVSKSTSCHPPGQHAAGKVDCGNALDGRVERTGTKHDAKNGQWIASWRARGPGLVEAYKPPSIEDTDSKDATSLQLTSQSLPQVPLDVHSKSTSIRRHRRTGLQRTGSRSATPAYHTSDILKVHNRMRNLTAVASDLNETQRPQSDKKNHEPESSSPTGKLLKIAHKAIARPSRPVHTERAGIPPGRHEAGSSAAATHIYVPVAVDPGFENGEGQGDIPDGRHRSPEPSTHHLDRISTQFWHPPLPPEPAIPHLANDFATAEIWRDEPSVSQRDFENEEMLEYDYDEEAFPAPKAEDGRMYFDRQQHLPVVDDLEPEYEGLPPSVGHSTTRRSLSHVLPDYAGSFRSASVLGAPGRVDIPARRKLEDELEDFWKPQHRLY